MLHIHGTLDTEEPFELCETQFKFYAESVLGCEEGSERTVFDVGTASCYEYASCVDGRRAAFCAVGGLGHSMPNPTVHGVDAIELAVSFWRGGWPESVRPGADNQGPRNASSVLGPLRTSRIANRPDRCCAERLVVCG